MILCLSARAGTVEPLPIISVILVAFQSLNDIASRASRESLMRAVGEIPARTALPLRCSGEASYSESGL